MINVTNVAEGQIEQRAYDAAQIQAGAPGIDWRALRVGLDSGGAVFPRHGALRRGELVAIRCGHEGWGRRKVVQFWL
jgi:hypothetical protein